MGTHQTQVPTPPPTFPDQGLGGQELQALWTFFNTIPTTPAPSKPIKESTRDETDIKATEQEQITTAMVFSVTLLTSDPGEPRPYEESMCAPD